MKNFIILSLIVLLIGGGCLYERPYIIAQPPGPANTVVMPSQPTDSGAPQIEVWRPDPTLGFIQNYSQNIFIRLWIDSRPPAPPTMELGPEQAASINLFLGSHFLYAEGEIYLAVFGRWVSVGTTSRKVDIRNRSYSYGYAWQISFGDGDFSR